MSRQRGLFRSARRAGAGANCRGASRHEPRVLAVLSERRLRRRLPERQPPSRLSVHLCLRRHSRHRHRAGCLGPRQAHRPRHARRQAVDAGSGEVHPLSCLLGAPELGRGNEKAVQARRPHLLSPAQLGRRFRRADLGRRQDHRGGSEEAVVPRHGRTQAICRTNACDHEYSFWLVRRTLYVPLPSFARNANEARNSQQFGRSFLTMSVQTAAGKSASSVGWRTPLVVVVCGCLIALVSFGPRSSLGFFLTPMSLEQHWGRDVFSMALAIQNLLWGLGQPLAGGIADRFGANRVMVAGAILYALGLALMAHATTPGMLDLSAGVLIGLGPVSYTHLRAHETDSYLVCR